MKHVNLKSFETGKAGFKTRKASFETRKALAGWLFASPWVIGLILFFGYPLLSSIQLSFFSFKGGINPDQFIGLKNYIALIQDDIFWTATKNTLYYVILAVPLSLLCAIGITLLIGENIKGVGIYRVIVFIPNIVPFVAIAVLWEWLLNNQFGIVNDLLQQIGLPRFSWFASPETAMPSLVLIALWLIGPQIIIYLAGLKDIPNFFYEAAKIDGASKWKQFRHITLPLLTPVILFNVIMGIINGFRQFVLPYVITNSSGRPANSLMFYTMYLYRKGFQYLKMGQANAMAWMMFVIIMALTLFIFTTAKKWVHYMGE